VLGPTEIAALLGVSRGRANQLLARDGFPAPVAVLSTGRVWAYEAVADWARGTGRQVHPVRAPGPTGGA